MYKSISKSQLYPKILMVTSEYPPMHGGVGRYTYNLTTNLRKIGFDVKILCNESGDGDYSGLSPSHIDDSNIILRAVDRAKPDIVHIQYEQGMYGLVLGELDPRKTRTNIDSFYSRCKVPIVTTFHSAYTFKQWLDIVRLIPSKSTFGKRLSSNPLMRYWKSAINYNSFHNLNKEKLAKSEAGIVFSNYMSQMIGGGQVIFHGAEPKITLPKDNKETRRIFNLPENNRLALALGFMTSTKGWDILKKIDVPPDWTIVTNSSQNHYNKERRTKKFIRDGIIDLQKDYLSEEDLSMLFYSADAVILPYKVSSGSGVMFDALAHGLPFVATDLGFFREFATKGLGISVQRYPEAFAKALELLDKDYATYKSAVENFRPYMSWQNIASNHGEIYSTILEKKTPVITV